jgi:hypothetical protein
MPEALILEFTGVSEAEYGAVRWVPLLAYQQPGA